MHPSGTIGKIGHVNALKHSNSINSLSDKRVASADHLISGTQQSSFANDAPSSFKGSHTVFKFNEGRTKDIQQKNNSKYAHMFSVDRFNHSNVESTPDVVLNTTPIYSNLISDNDSNKSTVINNNRQTLSSPVRNRLQALRSDIEAHVYQISTPVANRAPELSQDQKLLGFIQSPAHIQERALEILSNDPLLAQARKMKQPPDIMQSILKRMDESHRYFNKQPFDPEAEAYWLAKSQLELFLGRYLFVYPSRVPFIRVPNQLDSFIFGGIRVKMFLDVNRHLRLQNVSRGQKSEVDHKKMDEILTHKYPILNPQAHGASDYPSMEPLSMGEAAILGECIRCIVPGWNPNGPSHSLSTSQNKFTSTVEENSENDASVSDFISAFEPLVLHLG